MLVRISVALLFFMVYGSETNAYSSTRQPLVRFSMVDERSKFGMTSSAKKEEAFTQAKSASPQLPCVILVSPYLDQNVGSVSRAMLNFGLTDL